MKNNIEAILQKQDLSINQLSKMTDMDYAAIYRLVHRRDLSNTQITTLARVAKALKVDVEDLYK